MFDKILEIHTDCYIYGNVVFQLKKTKLGVMRISKKGDKILYPWGAIKKVVFENKRHINMFPNLYRGGSDKGKRGTPPTDMGE